MYARPSLDVARSERSAFHYFRTNWPLPRIGLSYGGYGSAVSAEFPGAPEILQTFLTSGGGEIQCGSNTICLSQEGGATIPVGVGYKANYSANYAIFALRIKPALLEQKLAVLTGTPITHPLTIERACTNVSASTQALSNYLRFLSKELYGLPSPGLIWSIAQSEELLLTLFLHGNRHNYSHLLEQRRPDAAPWQVRYVEEYIEATGGQQPCMEQAVDATGVGGLSLARTFEKRRGYSPRVFAVRMRRRHKQRDLQ